MDNVSKETIERECQKSFDQFWLMTLELWLETYTIEEVKQFKEKFKKIIEKSFKSGFKSSCAKLGPLYHQTGVNKGLDDAISILKR